MTKITGAWIDEAHLISPEMLAMFDAREELLAKFYTFTPEAAALDPDTPSS